MSNVVNIFDFKKKQCEKKGDTAGYNFAEVMKKNADSKKKHDEERLKETQDIANGL